MGWLIIMADLSERPLMTRAGRQRKFGHNAGRRRRHSDCRRDRHRMAGTLRGPESLLLKKGNSRETDLSLQWRGRHDHRRTSREPI